MTSQSYVRQQILTIRKSLDQSYVDHHLPLFQRKILNFCQNYRSIAIYCAVHNEISLQMIMDAMQERNDVTLVLPRINADDALEFVHYPKEGEWQYGAFNIPEPTTSVIDFTPELFLVPLSVIDHTGTRVGMGKGYYDRYLQNISDQTTLVGVGWDFQLVDEVLDRQAHDVPMDMFISPSHMLAFDHS